LLKTGDIVTFSTVSVQHIVWEASDF